MRKKIRIIKVCKILFIFIGISSVKTYGQIGINTPNPYAELDVVSTTSGVLVPRYTGVQIEALIATPTASKNGMLVFCTSGNGIYVNQRCLYSYIYDSTTPANSAWASWCGYGGGYRRNVTIVTGSKTVAAPYTVQPTDDVIFCRFSSTDVGLTVSALFPYKNTTPNIILPDPSTCKGRQLVIYNDSGYSMSRTGSTVSDAYTGVDVLTNYPFYTNRGSFQPSYNLSLSNTYQGNYTVGFMGDMKGTRIQLVSDGTRWLTHDMND
jgi:hypothetical protein